MFTNEKTIAPPRKGKRIVFFGAVLYGFGGVEYVLTQVANHLSENYEIVILSSNAPSPSKIEISPKVKVVTVNPQYKFREKYTLSARVQNKSLSFLQKTGLAFTNKKALQKICLHLSYPKSMQKALIDMIEKIEPDCTVGVGRGAMILGLIADKIHGKKVGWHHNLFESIMNYDGSRFWPELSRYIPALLSRLDGNLVLSGHDKEMFSAMGISCRVMPNFIDLSKSQSSSLQEKQMISVGRLAKEKRFDLLISLWRDFSENHPDWVLKIYGDGKQKESLRQLIQDSRLENSVFLCGFTNQIEKEYAMSSVNLCASSSEGFGLMAVEGMAAGLPFVAFDLYPFRDFVAEGKTGFLVSGENKAEFLSDMEKLADSYALRKQMSVDCREMAKRYEINAVMKKWDAFMAGLIGPGQQNRTTN